MSPYYHTFSQGQPPNYLFFNFFRISAFYLLPNGGCLGYSLRQSEFMREQFYILRQQGAVPEGPFFREALTGMRARAEITDVTPCMRIGQGEWLPYAELPPPPQCPPSYTVWSMISVFCCFPFSLIAIRQSSRVAELYAQGLYAEACAASRSARRWNMIFTVTVVLLLIFCAFAFHFAYEVWQGNWDM